ncbi:hypothetical protein K501DRAFT_272108 [Backusella circina FSU 941]|nr:hypothetical protein K501DRAFT_272108 [Backusella circina FSU 941]
MENTYKTVTDLQTQTTGTSSAFENAELIGNVQMVFASDHSHEKGTLLLYDMNENKYIPCLVDYYHPEYFNRNISIKKWSFIYSPDSGICFIEFEFKHVYMLASQTPLLLDILSADSVRFDLAQRHAIPFLVGRVTAISSLYHQSNEVYFLLELTTATILFQGDDAIMYHTFFQLDWHYCFTNTTAHNSNLEQFQQSRSKVYMIKRTQYDDMNIDKEDPPTAIHIEGTITRVIDIVFGLYELDEHHVICLYDSPQYWPTVFPLRIGIRLSLFHVHILSLSADERHPFIHVLWTENTTENHYIIATCLRSYISIVSFPHHWDFDDTTWGNQEDLYIECVSHRYKLTQVLCELALSFTLQQNFTTYPSNIPAINKEQHTDGFDLKSNFMQHTSHCQLVPTSLLSIPFYSTLKEIKETVLYPNMEIIDENNAQAGGSGRFISTLVSLQQAFYKETVCFLGIIDVGMDGKLYVMDKSQKFYLVLPEKDKSSIVVGGLYEFSQFRLIREDLSFDDEHDQRCALVLEYMICSGDDLVLRGGPLTGSVHYHYPLSELAGKGQQQLVGFFDKNLESTSKVFYVKSIHPLTMVNNQHELSMECRVFVSVYEVIETGSIVEFNMNTIDSTFVFSSQHRSLQHMVHLEIGAWYVITGLESPVEHCQYDISSEAVIIKIEQTRSDQVSTLSPIYKPKNQLESFALQDHQNQPRKVYTVSEALTQMRQGNIHDSTLLSIRGVIVSKAWDLRHGSAGESNENARKLFSDLGIGTGKKNRDLFFKLRQRDDLESIDIFMTAEKQYYPMGLLPGTEVIFHQVSLKRSAYNVFFKTMGTCTYEIIHPGLCTPGSDPIETSVHEHQTISSFYTNQSNLERSLVQITKIFVTVSKLYFLELKWKCLNCNSAVRHDSCYGMCENAHRVFYANCLAEVTDGTANMVADMEGERLVFQFLGIGQTQAESIKEVAMQGALLYKQFNANNNTDISLGHFIKSCRQRSHWMYGKAASQRAKSKSGSRDLLADLGLTPLRIYANDQAHLTCQYAVIKFKVVEIEQVDPINAIMDMVDTLY